MKNGKKLKCHHSFGFDDDDFKQFTHQQRKTLYNERNSNRKRSNNKDGWKKELEKNNSRIVSEILSQLKDSSGSVSEITQQNTAPQGLPSSIMGGRNAQDKRNKGGRSE